MALTVISLGAGVQSTTLALMAAHGEIGPMPDCAIFADTGWEPKAVYAHLEWLASGVLPFPVHIVTQGNLRDDQINRSKATARRVAAVPWFMRNPDGSAGMGRRQCTSEYKLKPIRRKVVELLGDKRPAGGCEMWIGISTDEIQRAKDSRVKYIINRFPLLFEKRMNRVDCLAWLSRHNYPKPPRSACIGCPFRKNEEWRHLSKEEMADAIEVDRAIRNQPKIRGTQFMHRNLIPLEDADLTTLEDLGQGQLGFVEECEGMCGV